MCSHLFLPRWRRPSPSEDWVGFPRLSHELRLLAGPCFEVADISLCSGLQVCSPPRSSLPLRILPQGSRGFYIRAYRALLPPHAPDMLTVRIQAIDGTGTCTLLDSQPCRLLTSIHRSRSGAALAHDPLNRPDERPRSRLPLPSGFAVGHTITANTELYGIGDETITHDPARLGIGAVVHSG